MSTLILIQMYESNYDLLQLSRFQLTNYRLQTTERKIKETRIIVILYIYIYSRVDVVFHIVIETRTYFRNKLNVG